jgi:hypothetical protein
VPVAPRVDGGYRYAEVFGEDLDSEQLINPVHRSMMPTDPFTPVSTAAGTGVGGFLTGCWKGLLTLAGKGAPVLEGWSALVSRGTRTSR